MSIPSKTPPTGSTEQSAADGRRGQIARQGEPSGRHPLASRGPTEESDAVSIFTADLDGDGVEDIVIPARCSSPMMDQAENSYSVIDPYDGFFGYGNPAVTTQFSSEDPLRKGYSLLIIHGSGIDAWRSDVPKAKFMVVNLPYRTVVAKKFAARKRIQMAIYVNETGAGDDIMSILFWDGKKYRYSPLGSGME